VRYFYDDIFEIFFTSKASAHSSSGFPLTNSIRRKQGKEDSSDASYNA
jgi:hypothetical protein